VGGKNGWVGCEVGVSLSVDWVGVGKGNKTGLNWIRKRTYEAF